MPSDQTTDDRFLIGQCAGAIPAQRTLTRFANRVVYHSGYIPAVLAPGTRSVRHEFRTEVSNCRRNSAFGGLPGLRALRQGTADHAARHHSLTRRRLQRGQPCAAGGNREPEPCVQSLLPGNRRLQRHSVRSYRRNHGQSAFAGLDGRGAEEARRGRTGEAGASAIGEGVGSRRASGGAQRSGEGGGGAGRTGRSSRAGRVHAPFRRAIFAKRGDSCASAYRSAGCTACAGSIRRAGGIYAVFRRAFGAFGCARTTRASYPAGRAARAGSIHRAGGIHAVFRRAFGASRRAGTARSAGCIAILPAARHASGGPAG